MDRLNSNWPMSMSDRDVVAGREAEFRVIFNEVGPDRFERGVTAAIRNHATGFFPSLGEFSRFVPDAHEQQHRETCVRCQDMNGFIWGESTTEHGVKYIALRGCTHGRL